MSPRNFLRWQSAAVTTECLQDRVRSKLDLLFAAHDHFHEPAADRDTFTRAYGYNLLIWPGWQTLRDISEAHSLASYIRRAPTTPAAATELTRRLRSLCPADPTIVWASIS